MKPQFFYGFFTCHEIKYYSIKVLALWYFVPAKNTLRGFVYLVALREVYFLLLFPLTYAYFLCQHFGS